MPTKHPAPALRHPAISLRMAEGGSVDLGLVQRAQSMHSMANADYRPMQLSPIQSDPISVGLRDGGEVHPWSIKGMVGRAQAAMADTPEQAAHKAGLAEYKARASAERSAPAAPAPQTAAPMGSQTVIDRRMAAAGLQDGGEVPGEGKGDKIPAMYEPGEFVVSNDMLKARPSLRAELQELREGVLNAQGRTVEEADANAIKMDDKGPSLRAASGFDVAPYVNHRNPNAPTPPGLRELGNSSSFKFGTDVAKTNAPNFTMGGNGPAAPAPTSGVTDVTPKSYEVRPGGPGNPNVGTGGSAEARAFRASQAPAPAAPVAPATPDAPAPSLARNAGASLRNAIPSRPVAGAGFAAGTAMATAGDSAQTPTDNYYRRLGMDPSDRSLGKDLAARSVGVLSDFGAGILDTPVGIANGVSRMLGGEGKMKLPGGNFGDILRRQDGEGGTPTDSVGAPAPALPTPQQAAPRPSLRASAPSATEAPATAAPEANVNVTRQANGVLSFSGKNIKGDVTYGGPEGGSLRSNPIGVVPGMDQRAIDSTLTNPNGTRWSSNDNAIMAANIRDGVDPYRGTSRGQNTGDPAMQQMEALATSPVGTPGRNGAIRALIAMKGDQTARRGQDMTYDASMTGTRATMESNRARMNYDMSKDQRDFKMRSEDQAFKQRGDADKNLTAELEAQFTTRGKDGTSEVDRNAVAEHKAAITAHLGGLIAAAEKRGDAATAEALRSQGAGALGKGEVQKLVSQLEAKKRIAASHGNMPWSGTFVDSADPSGYDVTGIKRGITQDQYTFRNGSTAPTRVLDYSQGGSNFLPNGLTDTRTTRFDNIKSLRQE